MKLKSGTSRFQIQSKPEHSEEWTLHYEGRLRPAASVPALEQVEPFAGIVARCRNDVPVEALYERLREKGVEFSSEFRVLRELKNAADEAWGRVELEEETGLDRRFLIHPLLLDGSLQAMAAVSPMRIAMSPICRSGMQRLAVPYRPARLRDGYMSSLNPDHTAMRRS